MDTVINPRKIYIAHISREARERDIGRMFEEAGRIISLEYKGDYAFVEYDNIYACEEAIRRFHGCDFMSKRLVVEPYCYRGGDFRYRPAAAPNPAKFRPRSITYRLYITGLDSATSWQDVKDFARTGGRSVCYSDVYTKHGKKEAIIEYSRREDYEYALRYLDKARLNGARVRVYDERDYKYKKNSRSKSRSRSIPKRSRSRSLKRSQSKSSFHSASNNNNKYSSKRSERRSPSRRSPGYDNRHSKVTSRSPSPQEKFYPLSRNHSPSQDKKRTIERSPTPDIRRSLSPQNNDRENREKNNARNRGKESDRESKERQNEEEIILNNNNEKDKNLNHHVNYHNENNYQRRYPSRSLSRKRHDSRSPRVSPFRRPPRHSSRHSSNGHKSPSYERRKNSLSRSHGR